MRIRTLFFLLLILFSCKKELEEVKPDDPVVVPDSLRDDNLLMGNPSQAVTDEGVPDNYLLVRPQYTLSYNNSKGEANWVSWHLSASWKGSEPRCDCFEPDTLLPVSFYHAITFNYSNTGFDRG